MDSPATSSSRTRIRFSVSVPVLSVQMTVAEPKASTAAKRRTTAWRRAMRCTPSARLSVIIAGIDLSATKAIEARVASAGQGGFIEVHAGSPTGKLVATIEVKPTGDWQKWATSEAAVVSDPGGNNELFFVFKAKSGGGGGLFNVNWVHFVEK